MRATPPPTVPTPRRPTWIASRWATALALERLRADIEDLLVGDLVGRTDLHARLLQRVVQRLGGYALLLGRVDVARLLVARQHDIPAVIVLDGVADLAQRQREERLAGLGRQLGLGHPAQLAALVLGVVDGERGGG